MAAPAPRGIVTPEAVLLEFETATVASRGLARAIDLAAQGGVFLAIVVITQVVVDVIGADDWVITVILIIAGFVVLFLYPVICELMMSGRSPGKAALGLRVVTTEGAPVRARHAAIRSALTIVDLAIPPVAVAAVLSMLLSDRSQRLGDLVAGTVVLRERNAAQAALAVTFPVIPGYEQYVASLDVGALTVDQYGLIRSFLVRVGELAPAARAALADRLARPIAEAMGHQPPVPAEVFLACVAAGYQQRHGLAAPATSPFPTAAIPPPPPPLPPVRPPSEGPFSPPS